MNYLLVDLYNDFQCIAEKCPDTCCAGWNVFIDEETYEKMETQEEALGIAAEDWIINKDGCRSVKMDSSMRCPMLEENKLCRVVRKLGPEYLSKTCKFYPRNQKRYGSVIEGHLVLSCPEVVSRLMDKPELEFDFIEGNEASGQTAYQYEQLYSFEAAVRIGMVEIFQHPSAVSLQVRAAAAFELLEEAVRMYRDGQTDVEMFRKKADWYLEGDRLYNMDLGLERINNRDSRYHFRRWVQMLLDKNNCSRRFIEMICQMNQYFSENSPERYASDEQKFQTVQSGYYDFHLRYWVYRIFSELIVIPDFDKAKEKFMSIAAGFCVIQSMAQAAYAKKGILERDEYIYIISNMSRKLEHNKVFLTNFNIELEKKGVNSLAGLLLLV